MAFRYQKIQPQSTPFPIILSTMGTNGVFEFNIAPNTTFNLSKSLLNISVKVPTVASRYIVFSAVASQLINRIQLVNSKNEILCNINDAYSYSANTMLNCNSGLNAGLLSSQNTTTNTQALADLNTYYNISKTQNAGRTGADGATSQIMNPILYIGQPTVADSFNTWASEFGFIYPKTLFSFNKNIHTKEELKIIITINPVDLFTYMTTTTPATSYLKTQSIPEGTSSMTTFNINLYIVPNQEIDTNFIVNTIEPEIQKILITSQTIHNVRIMLKPNKDIGFIAWSPYHTGYQTGSSMFGNSLLNFRDNTAVTVINNYDLRLSGNPLVQNAPVSIANCEHLIVNRFHYENGFHQTGISINSIGSLGFVDYTTFDGRSIYDFDPNDTSYLNSEIPLELTNDVILASSGNKQHQFVIGYKKIIKSENGLLSVV